MVHAVVVDQHMPGMTGMDLTTQIRALPSYDRTPILFVSGDGSPTVRIRALQAGATDFMVKPVVLDELVARVEVQLRVNATWQSTVGGLSRRAESIAQLADFRADGDLAGTAAALCQGISRAEDGAPVTIYESRSDGTQILLGSIGEKPSFVSSARDLKPSDWLRKGTSGVPWEHRKVAEVRVVGSGMSWACAPIRRGASTLGLLVLGGSDGSRDPSAVGQLPAAAVEYAAVAALHLGFGLTDARRFRERWDDVVQTLTEHKFGPVFQPVVDLANEGHVGYQAMIEFFDGASPDKHLSEAAEVGLLEEMELAMVLMTMETSALIPGEAWISMKMSMSTLIDHTAELKGLTAKRAHPLIAELSEADATEKYGIAWATLGEIGIQVGLSIDANRAGFGSLRRMAEVRPRFFKLDSSWVAGIQDDDALRALAGALVGFATQTGTDVIAEGIESADERQVLESLRVTFGQGALFGVPLPLIELLQQRETAVDRY